MELSAAGANLQYRNSFASTSSSSSPVAAADSSFRQLHAPDVKLWWPWMMRLLEPLVCAYMFCLFALWLIDGSDIAINLQLGYWFAWQLLLVVILVPPYVAAYRGTFDGVEDRVGRKLIVEKAAVWIHVRTYVQLIGALAAAVVNWVFFGLRIAEFINNCGTGTLCDSETTAFAVVTILAAILGILALVLALVITQFPILSSVIVMPAPIQGFFDQMVGPLKDRKDFTL